MTTFTSPLQSGTKRHAPGKNLGQVLLTQTDTIDFNDTTKDLFVLPAQSQIIDFYVDVTTAFNAAGTDLLDVGTSGDPDAFVDNQDLAVAGRFLGSGAAAVLADYADVGTSDVTVQATYTQTSTAATAGAARITVVYAVNKVLPA